MKTSNETLLFFISELKKIQQQQQQQIDKHQAVIQLMEAAIKQGTNGNTQRD